MSLRSNGTGDHLALTGSFGITTGDFSLGHWAKFVDVRDGSFSDLVTLATDEVNGSSNIAFGTNAATPVLSALFDNISGGGDDTGTAFANATWYWCTIVRSGTTLTVSVFDDTASTTPSWTIVNTGAGGTLTTLDWVIISTAFTGEWADAEFANLKLHVGIAWTNAQSRAESQHTATQLGGGTWPVVCPIMSTSVLTNFGTLGGSITNTGLVNGASNPTQLTDDVGGGGGGSGFVPDEDYQIFVAVRHP